MTGIAHLLEDFGGLAAQGVKGSLLTEVTQDQELAAFDQGYKAGWEDALKAEGDSQAHVGREFAQNLMDINFTFQEVYAHLLRQLNPFLDELVNVVLPELSQATLGARIHEELIEMAKGQAQAQAELTIAPSARQAFEKIVDHEIPFPTEILEDPSLNQSQVFLRLGESERQIDMSSILASINEAVSGFVEENNKEANVGK